MIHVVACECAIYSLEDVHTLTRVVQLVLIHTQTRCCCFRKPLQPRAFLCVTVVYSACYRLYVVSHTGVLCVCVGSINRLDVCGDGGGGGCVNYQSPHGVGRNAFKTGSIGVTSSPA